MAKPNYKFAKRQKEMAKKKKKEEKQKRKDAKKLETAEDGVGIPEEAERPVSE
ncbi:conserved protein of unknown function [Pseudodesulfovibrio piezophilus C1TLV30]|uniref:Uncharacterized protein n=1 Tax=Pseudodesulfovibrio piezophilus (strain DSM 21447 / JCM 15486 / C1TLV30) TaxID=1322246 RepID=M1WJN8_PSEP2|nr:conserved protein of unknown function [Pseudodesulfovibrio piezophilus C1TLV30]